MEVKNVLNVSDLLMYLKPSEFVHRTALVQWKGQRLGTIISADQEWAHIRFADFEQEEQIASSKVIPSLPTTLIEQVLKQRKVKFDLYQAIKEHSLALEPSAPRMRVEKTLAAAKAVAATIFPFNFSSIRASLQPSP